MIGLLYLVISRIAIETVELVKDLPRIYESVQLEVQGAFANLGHLVSRLPQGVQDTISRINENLGGYVSDLVQKVAFPTVTVAGQADTGGSGIFDCGHSVVLLLYCGAGADTPVLEADGSGRTSAVL